MVLGASPSPLFASPLVSAYDAGARAAFPCGSEELRCRPRCVLSCEGPAGGVSCGALVLGGAPVLNRFADPLARFSRPLSEHPIASGRGGSVVSSTHTQAQAPNQDAALCSGDAKPAGWTERPAESEQLRLSTAAAVQRCKGRTSWPRFVSSPVCTDALICAALAEVTARNLTAVGRTQRSEETHADGAQDGKGRPRSKRWDTFNRLAASKPVNTKAGGRVTALVASAEGGDGLAPSAR